LVRALEDRAGGRADGGRARLVSTYFDTPDHALARRGIAFRVRETNGHFVQTVKTGDTGAISPLARGEWEDCIAGAVPNPEAPETSRFLDPETARQLAPLFRTEIARRTIALSAAPETELEVAIDRGRICAADRAACEPVSEVELELKCGRLAALYDVALDLITVAPLRLERRSKAERGYQLAAPDAVPVAAVHGTAIDLSPDMSGSVALQRIGLACLDHIMQNEAAALAGLAEGIHQMRVGVRCLRAALTAFGEMLRTKERRWASQELRWVADALGAARNLDVFVGALIAPARKALGTSAELVTLRGAVERRRKAAYIEAAKAIHSARYTASMLRMLRWFETEGWCDGASPHPLAARIGEIAPEILARRRTVARRRAKGFAGQAPAERHRLRIALKKLRYATEMLGGLCDAEAAARFTKQLKRLQDDLGDTNDVRVGHDILAQLPRRRAEAAQIREAGSAVLGWHERRLVQHEPKLRQRLDAFQVTEAFWPR
jgi:triphosphatase